MASQITQSASCEFVDSDIIEIVPGDEYDSQRAKLKASLAWLVSKVYGHQVPKELQNPFYETTEGQLVLRPVVVNLLSSSELYCQACSVIFPETYTQWKGHWSIIQVLSRKSIYIADVKDSAVTETVLVQTAPFRLKAHLALIDALMRAYMSEVASVEKVVKAVRRFTSFNASSELPSNPEEALLFWITKVCHILSTTGPAISEGEQLLEGQTSQRVRIVSKSPAPRESIYIPLMEDLMRDIGDGCNLAAVISYYRPQQLSIKDICLKDQIGIADSLYNLRRIGDFCKNYLPWKAFHLAYEDLLYTHDYLKVNIYTFVTDFFYCFEGPVPISTDSLAKVIADKTEAAGKKSTQSIPSVPISNATKKSFQKLPQEDTSNNSSMNRSFTSPGSHQPLLGRRAAAGKQTGVNDSQVITSPPYACDFHQPQPPSRRGRRVQSLSSPQERDVIRNSVLAWHDDQRLSVRSSQENSNLLANVSIDSDLDQSMNVDASLSVDLSSLESPRVPSRAALDPTHPDYMEVESLSSAHPSRYTSPQQPISDRAGQPLSPPHRLDRREPLMPALLKTTKERVAMTKAEERGDKTPRRKRIPSPTEHSHSLLQQTQSIPTVADEASLTSSWSDETNVSSLPPGESQSPRYLPPQSQARGSPHPADPTLPQRLYDAFKVGADDSFDTCDKLPSHATPPQSARSDAYSVAESYTVNDRPQTAQAAIAAGIPIVPESIELNQVSHSREGSVASSGEYSDHESAKIHQDHKKRESGPSTIKGLPPLVDQSEKSLKSLVIMDKLSEVDDGELGGKSGTSSTTANTTSFAELKRLKDKTGYKVDNSGLVYMQSGNHLDAADPSKTSVMVKEQGQGDRGHKPAVSFQSPPTISWQQQQHQYHQLNNATTDNGSSSNNHECPPSDLQQLRLKLEQKRKEIEKKKHRMEAQQNKMRQRLGKAAFMRVVSKHMDQTDTAADPSPNPSRLEASRNSTQAQLQARLGHPGPRLPLSTNSSPSPQSQAQSVYLGHRTTATPAKQTMPPDVSAQRFTDWRTQSQQSNNASGLDGGNFPGPIISGQQGGGMSRNVQPPSWDGAGSDSSSSGSSSQTAANKAFSREGIQQTIDNVKNRWFKGDSDLISGAGSEDEMDGDVTSYRFHQSPSPSPRASQTPPRASHPHISSSSPVTISSSTARIHSSEEETVQEYDSSLDKLNNSLTELQGEIMRLSLQHEQMKATQSPGDEQDVVGLSDAFAAIGSSPAPKNRPIHGIPAQAAYVHGGVSKPQRPQQQQRQEQPPQQQQRHDLPEMSRSITATTNVPSPTPFVVPEEGVGSGSDNSSNDGFFISFANDSTPKRPKSRLSETLADNTGSGLAKVPQVEIKAVPQGAINSLSPPEVEVARSESPASVVYVLQDSADTPEKIQESDMEKKKIKLLEMQKKRKEDQERKRMEKEAEAARKQGEKQQKEEELERKKAEDKAKREAIFQQYLHKKQMDEEEPAPVKHKPKPERRANSRPRPKSMYIKAMTPEPGARGGFESNGSSQEDLRLDPARRGSPNIMSAMRSSYHFRAPGTPRMRKAVSCNTLSQNGAAGPATYRRPPSPDTYRTRPHRNRGNSQDSGSETGSGSNPGSDYAGPKLYVKPSSKSNRHIIVNAISHCCLAGCVNTDMKNKVLEEMSKCEANHFLILFRDAGCQYRGLFIFYPETEEAFKVFGVGPKHITNKICEKFYKYNSGAKSFTEIVSTKHLSVSVDAVVLLSSVWKTGKAAIRR